MRTNALSVANYFVDLAQEHHVALGPLRLMKLVYIAYGYALALLDRSIIDPRFDSVEAWKFGPVIPSVYYSFKQYGRNAITRKTTIIETNAQGELNVVIPELKDNDVKQVCRMVWDKYSPYADSDLVTILHGRATPWGRIYQEGRNRIIPETWTRDYYKTLITRLIAKNRENEQPRT